MVLGKIVGCILFSCCPDKIEHFLFYAIFDPPVAHVEGFGEFGAHVGCEDAVCCDVVSLEWCAVWGLRVTKFYAFYTHGAAVACAEVDAARFGF